MFGRALSSLLAPIASERDEAWARAEALLACSLTPEQHRRYRERGHVDVPSSVHPGRTYRVDAWRPVGVYEQGRFVGAVCIRPREHLPGPDVVLARKLMIEGAEDEFLAAGNWLQPAWRPGGTAPTILLVFALLSPWLLHVRSPAVWGALAAALVVAGIVTALSRVRRGLSRQDAGSAASPGTSRAAAARTAHPRASRSRPAG